jgi:hypothetical protein
MHRPKKTATTATTATKRPEKKKLLIQLFCYNNRLARKNISLVGEKNFPRGSGKKLFQGIT